MPQLFLPVAVRELTAGQQAISVAGGTVRELLDAADSAYPGIKARLVDGEEIRGGLAVIVDDKPNPRGLDARVSVNSEVHFLPPISGG